jgi:hypothetical protein
MQTFYCALVLMLADDAVMGEEDQSASVKFVRQKEPVL